MASSALSRSAIVCGGYLAMSGYHLLEIEGYSRTKDLPPGEFISSCSFKVGESSWRISYYPNGNTSSDNGYISVFLHLQQAAPAPQTVNAQAKFSLIDPATGEPEPSHVRGTTGSQEFTAKGSGFAKFIKRAWLDKSTCLKDDCFTIRCDVVVYKQIKHSVEERRVQSPSSTTRVLVPPSNLNSQIGDLLGSKETAAVTFQVGGEVFAAHRCILAARSPVFKAELFISEMKESRDTTVIRVDDMEAKVFGSLLRFIYTDDMLPNNVPSMTRQEEVAMAQHLLVAADRYNLDRLKLICEDKLCKLMDVRSVATILTLAEQHNCHGLKKACFQFLGSPWTLNNAMATEGFEHLERSCPSVLKELFSKVVYMHKKERRIEYWRQFLILVVLCIVLYLKGGSVLISCICFFLASLVAANMD